MINKEARLFKAVEMGDLSKVKGWHRLGADIHMLTPLGRGALSIAAVKGYTKIVEYIMQHHPGEDIATTALGDAIREEQRNIAELLVRKYNVQGRLYTFEVALEKKYLPLLELMIDTNRKIKQGSHSEKEQESLELDILNTAIAHHQEEAVKLLVEKYKIKVNNNPDFLYLAVRNLIKGNSGPEIIKILIDNGADIETPLYRYDYNLRDDFSYKLIHVILSSNKLDMLIGLVEDILNKKANVNAKDDAKNTPLHVLMQNKDVSSENLIRLTKMLIEAGADINAQNNFKNTPLHILVQAEGVDHQAKQEMIRFLIVDCKANTALYNKNNNTIDMICTPSLQRIIAGAIDTLHTSTHTEENTAHISIQNSFRNNINNNTRSSLIRARSNTHMIMYSNTLAQDSNVISLIRV